METSSTDTRADWRRLFESAVEGARRLAAEADADAANLKPGPDRWSANECIDHLERSMAEYLPLLRAAIERGRAKGKHGEEPFGRGTFVGRFLVKAMRRGRTKRYPAPRAFRPAAGDLDLPALVDAFVARAEEMIALLEDADGLALGRIRFATPVSRLLRVSAAQAFEIHALHNHRHLEQAEEALRETRDR